MKLVIDISEHEWEYLNKLVANNDIVGHYERLLVNGSVLEQEPKTAVLAEDTYNTEWWQPENNCMSCGCTFMYGEDYPKYPTFCPNCGKKFTALKSGNDTVFFSKGINEVEQ